MAVPASTVLHYVAPAVSVVCYLTASTVGACLLQSPSKGSGTKSRRYTAAGLLLLIVALFIAHALTYIAQALLRPGWWAPQDRVVYVLSSIFLWAILLDRILTTDKPLWHPYISAWCTGFLFEVAIILVDSVPKDSADSFARVYIALQSVRALCFIALCGSGFWLAYQDHSSDALDAENQPLLSENDQTAKTQDDTAYGTNPGSDNDDSDDEDGPWATKEAKEQQSKRLAERGSWIAYLKDFRMLIPLVWPSNDRKTQLCLAVVCSSILTDRALNLLVPRQLGIVIDELTASAGTGHLPYKAIGLWALYQYLESYAGFGTFRALCQLPVQQYAYRKIGSTGFSHIMSLSMDFHNNKDSGELLAAMYQSQSLYDMLEYLLIHLAPTFIDLAIAIVYVTYRFDSYMTLVVLFTGVAYNYIGIKMTVQNAKVRRAYLKSNRATSQVQTEGLTNWHTVSHFNRGQYETDRYINQLNESTKKEMKYIATYEIGYALQSLVTLVGRLSAVFLAAYRVSQGTSQVGSFVFLLTYWTTIEGPLASVSHSFRRISRMIVDSERLLQLLRTKPSVSEREDARPLEVKTGTVEFTDVGFAYDARKPTIRDVTFKTEAGKIVALVGETGGGKSTILKLLYRYYDVTGGSIKIDGQDIRDVTLDSLRDSFSMVPQDPSLFNISIMENVRYARLDASDDEVQDACRAAAIHDKIMSFPDGYRSKVGERGVKLSGGELQRVSIARAILRAAPIVLLDEATSMVDAETESLIQKAFKKLTSNRTTFVIAHRLSTIQDADLILVIQEGQIVERGTHDELFTMDGKYSRLWSKQLSRQRIIEEAKTAGMEELLKDGG